MCPVVALLCFPFLFAFHNPSPLAVTERTADRTGSEGPLPFILKAIHILFNLSSAQSKDLITLYPVGRADDLKKRFEPCRSLQLKSNSK